MMDRVRNLVRELTPGRARPAIVAGAMSLLAGTALAADPGLIERSSYGASMQGRPLEVLRVTSDDGQPAGMKPAVLIVAGLDGAHVGGSEVAARLARKLAAHPDLPRDTDYYVIARANPDAAARLRAGSLDRGGVLDPVDEDRDRRVDEDGPIDLNGDGVITMMRVANPSISSGLRPTHVIDPDEPRLIRPADASEGERAVYAVLPESRDQDGDGRFGEDPAGHTALDRSFPYLWPEGETDAGAFPLAHRETHALADWLLENPHVVAVVSIGAGDDLRTLPDVGRMDQTGRVPTGIERGDKPAWDHVAELFEEATTLGEAPAAARAGSLHGWAYGHLGLYAWMVPVQGLPAVANEELGADAQADVDEADNAAPEPTANADAQTSDRRNELLARGVPNEIVQFMVAPASERSAMIAEIQSAPPEEQARMQQMLVALPADVRTELMAMVAGRSDEIAQEPAEAADQAPARSRSSSGKQNESQRWLAHADAHGTGYVDWTPFDHPQLGRVEIGGFVPGFKVNPDPARYDEIAGEHAEFLIGLAGSLPRLRVDRPEVEQTSPGVWRVRVRVSNQGELASTTAMMSKARRLPTLAVAVDVEPERVLVGNRRQTLGRLDGSGGFATAEWVVLASAGDVLKIMLSDPQLGNAPIEVELMEVSR